VLFFKKAIENMAASSLRCVASAYRSCEVEKVPSNEEQLAQWALPADDLVLLAIVGIKVFIFHGNLIKIYTYIARVHIICIRGGCGFKIVASFYFVNH
jgi:hypothetical protein